MSITAVRTQAKTGLDCYLLAIPAWRLFGFLNHDPRSRNWKILKPWLRHIYEQKQRATSKPRIDALKDYISKRLMSDDKVGAFPPISIIQFELLENDQLRSAENNDAVTLDDGKSEMNRVLIDGLARVTAVQDLREQFEVENRDAYARLKAFEFSVALYVPSRQPVDADVAGQLFSDFNSYAWPVPQAKTIADDMHNPYKLAADTLGNSELIRRHGGLKTGTANLGSKDTAFATQLAMSQFVKVAIEGRRAIGSLNKPVSGLPNIGEMKPMEAGRKVQVFLEALETAMGRARFTDRSQLWRSAHALYAIAVIVNDVLEKRTTLDQAVEGIAAIDWTWNNRVLRESIGRQVPDKRGVKQWRLNTGGSTTDWLIRYCRQACNVMIPDAA